MADTLSDSLVALLAPVVEGAGYALEGVEITRAGKYSVVRVLVDLADGPGDLDLDALEEITGAVSAAVDEADPVKGRYTLEVSTPGAERALSTPRHFRRAVGHTVTVTVEDTVVTGRLRAADDRELTLEVDGAPTTVSLAEVTDAHLVALLTREGDDLRGQ